MVNLGVFLPGDKAQKIRIPERIEELCIKEGVSITTIANIEQLTDHNIDVLLHKVLDFLNEKDYSTESAKYMINEVKCFSKNNPNIILIDDVESCLKISNRKNCYDSMFACEMSACGINVFVPKSIELVDEMPVESIRELVKDSNLRFPVLVKPLITNDKILTLVFNLDDLCKIQKASLVQEFSNHSGVMYKVFVMGERFSIIQRPSIKDYPSSETCSPISMDSKNVSKMGRGFHPEIHDTDPGARAWLSDLKNPDLLNREVIHTLSKKLGKVSNLFMFGYDILVVNDTGDYAIVDLNQFPGYKGIPDDVFADNFVHLVKTCKDLKHSR